MSRFIPIDKLKNLREAAKSGDELALKILRAQMNGDDFSQDLDSYFAKPSVQEKESLPVKKTKLQQFLEDNGVNEGDEDYDATVEMYYKEFPNEKHNKEEVEKPIEEEKEESCFLDDLIKDELEAIEAYSNAISKVLMLEAENDTSKKGMIDSLEEIKRDEIDHLDKLRRIKANLHKEKTRLSN